VHGAAGARCMQRAQRSARTVQLGDTEQRKSALARARCHRFHVAFCFRFTHARRARASRQTGRVRAEVYSPSAYKQCGARDGPRCVIASYSRRGAPADQAAVRASLPRARRQRALCRARGEARRACARRRGACAAVTAARAPPPLLPSPCVCVCRSPPPRLRCARAPPPGVGMRGERAGPAGSALPSSSPPSPVARERSLPPPSSHPSVPFTSCPHALHCTAAV
jgi:hypothetical protein